MNIKIVLFFLIWSTVSVFASSEYTHQYTQTRTATLIEPQEGFYSRHLAGISLITLLTAMPMGYVMYTHGVKSTSDEFKALFRTLKSVFEKDPQFSIFCASLSCFTLGSLFVAVGLKQKVAYLEKKVAFFEKQRGKE